jgi:alkaline phosphatase D
VTGGRAIVWSRADRPARMIVEYATTESFERARRVSGSVALAANGFTARVDLASLPRAERVFYRVLFEELSDSRNVSAPSMGSFMTAPVQLRDVTFAWSADTAGQGWGINPDWGGMRIYDTIRRARPDFFVHCGDTIYADQPLVEEVPLGDGTVWKNIVTPAKAKVAETLDEFRGNHLYNLMDEHVRRFNAEIPQVVLWDDHEVRNNWYPAQTLEDDPRYRVKSVRTLAARARQAFLEHVPIRVAHADVPPIYRSFGYGPALELFALDLRTYRWSNSRNRQPHPSTATALAGPTEVQWLKRQLQKSSSTWKVIASDLPIGLIVRDGETFEAVANGDDGPPLGRELEIADLLRFIRDQNIKNVVWVTADVHYAAAHHYDPERAQFKAFRPFWEFVAGPLHAGTGPPIALDSTFGPEARFISVPPGLTGPQPPSAGRQFFGLVHIPAANGGRVMTVSLHNLAGDTLYRVDLEAE